VQALGRRHPTLPSAPGQACRVEIRRMQETWTNTRLIHLPIHASWLNQIELYFSIVQGKALTPNDFDSLETSPSGYSASATATGKSPGRSTGHSPAQTSTVSYHESTPTNPNSDARHEHRTCGRLASVS
jgi:hypothetical protein